MLGQLQILWACGCLVALFGIWLCLYTRLPKSAPGEKPLSKKEKAALVEQEKIEAAAEAILRKQGLLPSKEEPDVASESPKLSRADQIKQKYSAKL